MKLTRMTIPIDPSDPMMAELAMKVPELREAAERAVERMRRDLWPQALYAQTAAVEREMPAMTFESVKAAVAVLGGPIRKSAVFEGRAHEIFQAHAYLEAAAKMRDVELGMLMESFLEWVSTVPTLLLDAARYIYDCALWQSPFPWEKGESDGEG